MNREQIQLRPNISASPEVARMIHTLPNIALAESMPGRMQGTLDHIRNKITHTLDSMEKSGRELCITGPEWARSHAVEAGKAHADVIHAAYGSTYALPNRDPNNNTRAIQNNELDMFLIFDEAEKKAIGTACTVLDAGRDELGRTASLGHVGNSLIQDLRILQWLTNEESARKTHTLFATLRTAPDRDIGEGASMRGGQGVCHIWSEMPGAIVEGFGPLYKKHGKLEQFACMSLSRLDMTMPEHLFVAGQREAQFIHEFAQAHALGEPNIASNSTIKMSNARFIAHVPPKELGIHTLVHADIVQSSEGGDFASVLHKVQEIGSPFVQLEVSIEDDTIALQEALLMQGFHGFQVRARTERNPASIVFGKVLDGSDVVPTFWHHEAALNPFWGLHIPSGESIQWR